MQADVLKRSIVQKKPFLAIKKGFAD